MSDRLAATEGNASHDALPSVAARPANRLVLFAPNLSGGGAERTLARLATHWAEQGRDVTLITLAAASPDDFPLPEAVRRIGLGLTAEAGGPATALRNNLRRIRAIREAFHGARPEVVVSFIEQANVLALLAARPLCVTVVVSERTDPSRYGIGRLWTWLRRRTYPRCTALVVLTDEIAEFMRPIVRDRPVVVIPNGAAPPTVPRASEDQRSERTILGVGRLSPEKGFGWLIYTFSFAAVDDPRWRLVILGEGPQRAALEKLVHEHALADRVELPGRVANPDDWYARADVFALSSDFEGFPNALLEAMAAGVPAVTFGHLPAVRQIVRHGIDGLLAPGPGHVGFFEALRTLIKDDALRHRMGEAARDVVNRFSLETFFARWDAVVDAAASGDFSQLSGPASE